VFLGKAITLTCTVATCTCMSSQEFKWVLVLETGDNPTKCWEVSSDGSTSNQEVVLLPYVTETLISFSGVRQLCLVHT